jgi:hypothetical protein
METSVLARGGMVRLQDGASVPVDVLPDRQWEIYREAIREARRRGIRFALGGAFALGIYTGRWRNTKDLDLYVLPENRHAMIAALDAAGLEDYYDVLPYDRSWIYRGHRGEIIVDAIWAMANQRAQVDMSWFERARQSALRGEALDVIPPEELLWQKLYIIQRERCDWPDVLNVIYAMGACLDWSWLLDRLGADRPVLAAALSLFGWLCPGRARGLPAWLWERLGTALPEACAGPTIDTARVALLDTRPWFPTQNGGG